MGTKLNQISFSCFDEGGRQTPDNDSLSFVGKASCGWMRKARKAVLSGAGCTIFLPPLDVGKQARSLQCLLQSGVLFMDTLT